MDGLFRKIFIIALFLAPVFSNSQTSQNIVDKAGAFVDSLSAGMYEAAMKDFDNNMKQALPSAKLKQIWESLQAQVGPFKEKLGIRTEKAGGYDIVFVVCAFENSNLDVKVVFSSVEKIAGLFFLPSQGLQGWEMPDYADPDSFYEVDTLKLANEWALPAVLTMPDDDGPFPAVILVHGSGPNDRDETIGPNKPFKDLAWGLASNEIAVLRYEKRTKFYPHKMDSLKDQLTGMEETVDDALAAVSLLRKTEKIDPDKVIVLGHSLGGTLVPRISSYYPRIGGFVIMAGASRPLEDLIVEQVDYIYSLDGKITDEEKNNLGIIKQQIENVKKLSDTSKVRSEELPMNLSPAYWLDLKNYDLAVIAKKMKDPILVLQGERDYQVRVADFEGWQRIFDSKDNISYKLYPDFNHLFISGQGKSTPGEYLIPGHVDKRVIEDISKWIDLNFED